MSTYALLVEDVLEVISDVVVVHEDAASRIQRLTKVPYSVFKFPAKCYGDDNVFALLPFLFLCAED